MKIGIVVNQLEPEIGGGYTFKLAILDALARADSKHEFIILDLSGKPGQSSSSFPRITIDKPTLVSEQQSMGRRFSKYLPGRFRRHDSPAPGVGAALQKAISENGITLAWFIDQVGGEVTVPYFYTVWDLQHRIQPWFPEVSVSDNTWFQREEMYNRMLKRASLVITGTNVGKGEIAQLYGVYEDNIAVIPLPVPLIGADLPESQGSPAPIHEKYGIPDSFLLYPAQFWAHKNHVNLLHALKIAVERSGSTPDLVLVGSDRGNLAHVRGKIEELGLEDRVHILGFVPAQDLAGLYQSALGLVFVSYFGPDNLPPLEAFHFDCPVIASGVSGATEQLGDAALLVDPDSPEDIADAILVLQSDSGLREKLVSEGKQALTGKSPDDYARQMIGHLDRFEKLSSNWM